MHTKTDHSWRSFDKGLQLCWLQLANARQELTGIIQSYLKRDFKRQEWWTQVIEFGHSSKLQIWAGEH